jgi:hypothetical protein
MSKKKKKMSPVTVTGGSSYRRPHTTKIGTSKNSIDQNGIRDAIRRYN